MSDTPEAPERADGQVSRLRDATRELLRAIVQDEWPRQAAVAEFGLRTMDHYEALYYPLRHGDITPEQVDAASGQGRMLTELVNSAPHNPHQGIEFRTGRDGPSPEPEPHRGDGKPAGLPSLSEIANGKPAPEPDNGKELVKDNGIEL